MMEERQSRESVSTSKKRWGRRHLRVMLVVVLLVLVLLVVPPWVSIGRYQGRIAQVLSASVGRPVQVSSVNVRLLPWPGFVITNLSIAEDPAYGAEPVLHANTVRANIRLFPLWRGRLEIGAIHVDEASLNIVRAGQGSWNLDPLFRTAAARAGGASGPDGGRWPLLEATNSRVNIKNGAEKLPFSLVDTNLTFWQENRGEWRVRLRGQPARTDVALETGDTGTVRIEAILKRSPTLGQMPLRIDLGWREAQLGQLSKLLIGSDPGWRGDLTGNLHLEGTPEAAQITMRLRATGVHRAEFAPQTSLDFDANCGLLYHYAQRAVENLSCNSPLGNGHIRLTGGKAGADQPTHLTAELDRIPVGAGLDILRTMRSGIPSDLEAAGTVSGRLDYAEQEPVQVSDPKPVRRGTEVHRQAVQSPLSGGLTVDGLELKGGPLSQPLQAPKITLEAVEVTDGPFEPFAALEGSTALNAGAASPLNVSVRLAAQGYEATFRGQAAIARAHELALAAGWTQGAALKDLAGEPLAVNLTAAGPWLVKETISAPTDASAALANLQNWPQNDSLTGTVTLRDANWKADYLANHVQIAQATLHLDADAMRWDTVAFSYGPVKGTAVVTIPVHCAEEPTTGQAPAACAPQFQIQFGELDVRVLEAALLGAQKKGTLLSSLLDRLHPAASQSWPQLNGTIDANVLQLGQAKLEKVFATVAFAADHADLTSLQGDLLGGQLHGYGSVHWTTDNHHQPPAYSIVARGERLNATAVGQLLGQRWSGGQITVGGRINLAGFTDSDLSTSAKGLLHFDWRRGAMPGGIAAKFDDWNGEAQIGGSAVTLGKNELASGSRKLAVEGAIAFGTPPKVRLSAPKTK